MGCSLAVAFNCSNPLTKKCGTLKTATINMKQLLVILCVLFSLSAHAGDKIVKDTTIKAVVYHIYEGGRGGHYILVTSKTGNTYKKYVRK